MESSGGRSDQQQRYVRHQMHSEPATPRSILRENGLAGTPAEVTDRIGRWREDTDISRLYLQILDLDHVELIAEEVLPVT